MHALWHELVYVFVRSKFYLHVTFLTLSINSILQNLRDMDFQLENLKSLCLESIVSFLVRKQA
jgi:hypothetical protein